MIPGMTFSFCSFHHQWIEGWGGVSKIQTIRLAYLLTLLWSGLWKGWCLQSHIAYLCTLPFSWPSPPPHTTMCPFSIVVKLKVLNAPKSFLTKHYGFLSHRPLDFFFPSTLEAYYNCWCACSISLLQEFKIEFKFLKKFIFELESGFRYHNNPIKFQQTSMQKLL